MKRILPVLLCLLSASAALAQVPEKRSEVFVGVGTGPVIFLAEDVASVFGTILTLGNVHFESEGTAGQLVLGYQQRLGRWFGAGVTGSWSRRTETAYLRDDELYKINHDMYTVVLDGRLHWLSRPAWDLYSGAGVGFAMRSAENEETGKEDTKVEAAANVTFLGARFGRDFGGFLEVGGYYNSIITAGLSARF